ncbi:hypothetical protein, partial [Streptomyces sp. NPDC087787]|uniref:hypothetical protein n=1 Tax=Streptomyces sp. NPDC087787 TaxID=3365803 RepID=UPI0038143E6D
MRFDDDLAGGVTLIRPALQSPNYDPGKAGWKVGVDGSAEFNDAVVRGGISVGGVSLYYNGTPGPGRLIMAVSGQAGTDAYGNGYPAGISVFGPDGRITLSTAAT